MAGLKNDENSSESTLKK